MPFSKTPTQSTYTSKPVKLLDLLDTRGRDGAKDSFVLNGHIEVYKDQTLGQGDYEVVKREGLSLFPYNSGSLDVRGTYFWKEQSKIYVAHGTVIDIVSSITGTVETTINVFSTTTGEVGFTEYLYDTGISILVATDGTTPVYIQNDDTFTVASTTRSFDATWTANTAYTVDQVIAPTVANGFLFKVAIGGTTGSTEPSWAEEEGAETDESTGVAYTAVSIINALPVPHLPYPLFLDGYLFLAKVGTADIYNSDLNDPKNFTAGSFISAEMVPDTLSRISKMNNYLVAFGTSSIEYFWDAANATGSPLQRNDTPVKFVGYLGGFAQMGNTIFFLGMAPEGGPGIYSLQDFKITAVSTLPIRKYVQPLTTTPGNIIHHSGKDFYILAAAGFSFALDLDSGLWTRLSRAADSDFSAYHSLSISYSSYGNTTLCFFRSTAQTYYFNRDVFQDDGVAIPFVVQTDLVNFDTNRYKMCSRIVLVADQVTASSTLTLYWSDDDYKTWTNGRPMDVGTPNPLLVRCGRFRKRAFNLSYLDNYPFRIKALELDINMAEH